MPDLRPAIVVTGASAGIGRAFAQHVAGRDMAVLLIGRSQARLQAVASEVEAAGALAAILPINLAEPASAAAVEQTLAERGWYCDILIYAAGLGQYAPAHQLAPGDHLEIVDVHVRAMVELVGRLLPGMRIRGRGGFLLFSSLAAYYPGPNMGTYFATKAFVRSFAQSLAAELLRTGVRVTCVCPGPVATDFLTRANAERARIFSILPVVDAAQVAAAGWQGFRSGKLIVIPGVMNRVLIALSGILPGALTGRVMRALMKRERG